MKIQQRIVNDRIQITEQQIDETYFIEMGDNGRFYITSSRGYNGFEGTGWPNIQSALREVRQMIKNYFTDRCESNPEGF